MLRFLSDLLDWFAFCALVYLISQAMHLQGWPLVAFCWCAGWLFSKRNPQFTINNRFVIPPDMDKETVAKLVALQQSHIERN